LFNFGFRDFKNEFVMNLQQQAGTQLSSLSMASTEAWRFMMSAALPG
jgi:hypothetical protein